MNEPKKRGRPSKAEIAARQALARELTAEVVADDKEANAGHPAYEVVGRRTDMHDLAQAYALRVWSGQSPDVPRNERLRRVVKALEGQGMSMEGVEL